MSNVIKCASDLGGADAYLYKDLGALRNELYVTFDIYIPQALVNASAPDGYVGDICHLTENSVSTSPNPKGILVLVTNPTTLDWIYQESGNTEITTNGLARDTWHTVSLHYLKNAAGSPAVQIDGTDYGALAANTPSIQVDGALIGLYGPSANTEPLYLRNIKFGSTAYGSSDLFSEAGGSLAGFTSTSGDVSVVDDSTIDSPVPPTPPWQFQLWNIADDTLVCDLTNATTATLSVRLNRPLAQTWTLAGDNTCINTVHADTDLNLCVGTRTMKAYQDGVLRANTPVENIEWTGDENGATVVVTGYDPLHRLLTRTVYDGDGSFVKPEFTTPISGGDLIKQMVDNSTDSTFGDDQIISGITPAVFPLATTGTFDTSIPPAVDLSFDVPDGPSTIAEVAGLITDSGAVDVVVTPTDTSLGADPGIVGELSAVNKTGDDLTATVHFDYNTGDKNVAKCRVAHDMGTVGNKIIYELGPPVGTDGQHWKGNITATETTPVNLAAFLAAEMTSREKYGTRTSISVYDSNGDENSARPLFHNLWETEVTTRKNPRRLLYMTPIAPSPFRPFIDFNRGDVVGVNVGAGLVGPAIVAEAQRIFGFDLTVTAEGLEQLGELVTSADAE